MSGFFTSVFHVVFGRRGATSPRSTPSQPAGSPSPGSPPAPPPVAEAPPPVAPPPAPPSVAQPPVTEAPAAASPPAPAPEPAPAEPPAAAAPEPEPPSAPAEPPAPVEPPPPPLPTDTAPEPAPIPVPIPTPTPAPEGSPPDRLTPNFRLSEFTVSETAQRLGIDNTPTGDKLDNVRTAAAGMERVRTLLGDNPISISSGFRNPDVNRAVGGSRTSDHMEGFSVDFRCDRFGTPYDIVERIVATPELMADVDQVIFEKGRWVHISFAPEKRGQVLTVWDRPGGGSETLAGLHRLDQDGRLIA